jgi:hypothetical protein
VEVVEGAESGEVWLVRAVEVSAEVVMAAALGGSRGGGRPRSDRVGRRR